MQYVILPQKSKQKTNLTILKNMKKLFTLLMMLIIGIGSMWADGLKVSTTESSSAEYQYKIFCRAASTYYLGNTTNATNSDYGLFAFYAATSDGYTNGYYIYSIFNGKWISYEAKASYTNDDEGQNKITLVDTKAEANPWYITADDTDNKYYDIRAFQSDKNLDASGNASWNWHGGTSVNTSNTMGFYDYDNGHSGWGIVLAGGSGSPVADRKVVAIYNRIPNGSEYPITSSVNSSGNVLSSNSTSATPQLFVLRQNGIDSNGEALYNLQKAEGDGKYFRNDASTPKANTYSTTSSNFVFLNTSSPFISNYSAILKDGTSIATSNYNLMARGEYYGCIHSKNNNASFDGWTSNANSKNKIQFYYSISDWNGLWSVKEQSYTAWQVVITGATESGSVTYKGSSLLSGATATQSNNGIFVISSASTPTSSDFTINNVDGYCTDPTVSIDNNRKLIKVTYVDYTESVNTLENTPIGVGYPTNSVRATLQAEIDRFNASQKRAADYALLYTACNTFNASTNVVLPEEKVYTIQSYIKSPSKTTYLKNESGTLTIGAEASATTLNNLWIVRKSGNTYVLQSAADQTKYIVYNSFTLGATGSDWSLSYGTEWPYISMYNSSLGNGSGRYVACNGSNQFGTAGGSNYYANDRTQSTGWSTDFKFVESPDFALYKVKIICPKGNNPTVTYSGTAYSNGADFVASTTLTTSDLTVSTIEGYTSNVSIDGDVIYVNYNVTLNNTYADTWNFDNSPWLLLNDVPDALTSGRTYRYNTKMINIATAYNSSLIVKFAWTLGNLQFNVAGVDLLNPLTGDVVYHEYHDGIAGQNTNTNNEYIINNVAPGNYILRYISYSSSTSSNGNITVFVTPYNGFYRIKAGVSNKYITGTPSSYQSFLSLSSEADAGTIIYLNNNKLLNYSKGLYQKDASKQAAAGGAGDDYTIYASANRSTYYTIYSTTFTNYIYDSGNTSSRQCVDRQGSLGGNYTDWQFEEVTELPFTFYKAALGYATFNSPVACKLDAGTKAYTCKQDLANNTINLQLVELTKDGNVLVPANCPVLLFKSGIKADDASNTVVNFTIVESDEEIDDNDFVGTIESRTLDTNYNWYSLQKVASGTNVGKMCFLSKSAGEGSYLGGFKAWIKTNPTTARQFTLVYDGEDDPTGIVEALGLENDNVEIYDMSGRKLSSYKKGINIVNGKKVMVQ